MSTFCQRASYPVSRIIFPARSSTAHPVSPSRMMRLKPGSVSCTLELNTSDSTSNSASPVQ